MQLLDWIKENGYTKMKVSQDIGASPNYLYRFRPGVIISTRLAKNIVKYTKGEVSLKDLRPDLFEE